ncbi:hypothetical protein BDZ89DRAFT_1120997 [Hymenopellis radicata]|nr:hypothetical protein BDZ89DRAFT_1120997 [Hymenopellis radicata]
MADITVGGEPGKMKPIEGAIGDGNAVESRRPLRLGEVAVGRPFTTGGESALKPLLTWDPLPDRTPASSGTSSSSSPPELFGHLEVVAAPRSECCDLKYCEPQAHSTDQTNTIQPILIGLSSHPSELIPNATVRFRPVISPKMAKISLPPMAGRPNKFTVALAQKRAVSRLEFEEDVSATMSILNTEGGCQGTGRLLGGLGRKPPRTKLLCMEEIGDKVPTGWDTYPSGGEEIEVATALSSLLMAIDDFLLTACPSRLYTGMSTPPPVAPRSHTTNKAPKFPGMGVLKKVPLPLGGTPPRAGRGRYKVPLTVPSLPVSDHSPDLVAQYTRNGVMPVFSSDRPPCRRRNSQRTLQPLVPELHRWSKDTRLTRTNKVMLRAKSSRAGRGILWAQSRRSAQVLDGAQPSNVNNAQWPTQNPSTPSQQPEHGPCATLYGGDDSDSTRIQSVAQSNGGAPVDDGSPDYTVEERELSAEDSDQSSDIEQVPEEPTASHYMYDEENDFYECEGGAPPGPVLLAS